MAQGFKDERIRMSYKGTFGKLRRKYTSLGSDPPTMVLISVTKRNGIIYYVYIPVLNNINEVLLTKVKTVLCSIVNFPVTNFSCALQTAQNHAWRFFTFFFSLTQSK